MKNKILNLSGTQKLSQSEQKMIQGGKIPDLSNLCGALVFNSTESQCLSLVGYDPIWNPATRKCSVIGDNC
ncbi:hypothetical protein LXD69_03125 [Flavobacterium sediminilitoris]|uniref:Natural product n=1 Tax=Flavobacterium sediminilitoris TaxID=2024526 RepID=A0ABY4HNR8_9FLAO|nr:MULTISPECIES: hypothetical protein [Flavobacterium]UOX34511.1 hypothetical protein LXD69_03125 [Flavobacterium sediminilitoris]